MNGESLGPHLPREAWEAWLADRLDGTARHRIEDHLAGCAECTAWVARTDPSHLFHRLRAPVPEPAWDGFWDGIQRDLGPRPRSRRPFVVATGVAAALALMVLVGVVARDPQRDPVAADIGHEAADPCAPTTLAAMNVSRPITLEECRLLHGGMAVEGTPMIIRVDTSIDLRGM